MIAYIIKVSICWILFYAVYQVLYKRISHFNMNRAYLVATLLLGTCIPLVEYISFFQSTSEVVTYFAPVMQEINQMQVIAVEASREGIDFMGLFFQLYLFGVLIASLRFLYGIGKIAKLYFSGKKEPREKYTLIQTHALHLPFSFFKGVFISRKIPLTEKMETILQHELCHISERHTYDVILMEICKIIFWCSPVIYLYKNAIRETHEYIADAVVLQHKDKKEYGQLLLGQSPSGIEIALAHSFFHSHLKNRITMMNQKNSSRSSLAKYLAIVPVALFLGILFMSNIDKSSIDEPLDQEILTSSWEELAKFVAYGEGYTLEDDIDLFVSTLKADPDNYETIFKNQYFDLQLKHKDHTDEFTSLLFSRLKDEKMNVNINIEEPERSLHFMVNGDGAKKEIKTRIQKFVDAVNGRVDYNKLSAIVNELNKKYPKHYNFINQEIDRHSKVLKKEELFMFGIRAKELAPSSPPPPPSAPARKGALADDIYKVVEEMPRFPGCEDVTGSAKEKEKCAQQKMLEYIYTNLKYPATARDAGVEGIVVVQFVVDRTGLIQNAKILRDIGEGYGAEALKVVNSMNDAAGLWTPGKQQGKNVDVFWTLPVRYKLSGESEKEMNESEASLPSPPPAPEDGDIFKVVDQMPRFPGCENIDGTSKEIENCAKEKMLEYIYKNLKYPAEAREAGIEGMCVVQFIVGKDGSILTPRVLRNIGAGTGEAALKVIEEMNDLPEKWTPGMQSGKQVKVMYTLPIRFRLEKNDSNVSKVLDTKEKIGKYFVDGKEVTRTVISTLSPDKIVSSKVFKRENSDVADLYILTKEGMANNNSNPLDLQFFKAFPSPVDDVLNLSFTSKDSGDLSILILDLQGKIIREFSEENHTGQYNNIINLSNAASGTLLIQIRKNGKSKTQTIIKQ